MCDRLCSLIYCGKRLIRGALQIQDRSPQSRSVASRNQEQTHSDATGLNCGDRSWICKASRVWSTGTEFPNGVQKQSTGRSELSLPEVEVRNFGAQMAKIVHLFYPPSTYNVPCTVVPQQNDHCLRPGILFLHKSYIFPVPARCRSVCSNNGTVLNDLFTIEAETWQKLSSY